MSFQCYNLREFLGIKFKGSGYKKNELVENGILRYIRHPHYAGTILIVLGYVLFIPEYTSLLNATCIFLYLAIGIKLEENKLIKEFGEAYLRYIKRVPMLIPRIKIF